eukprot:4941758-Pyramimonas_sp.AAC.1
MRRTRRLEATPQAEHANNTAVQAMTAEQTQEAARLARVRAAERQAKAQAVATEHVPLEDEDSGDGESAKDGESDDEEEDASFSESGLDADSSEDEAAIQDKKKRLRSKQQGYQYETPQVKKAKTGPSSVFSKASSCKSGSKGSSGSKVKRDAEVSEMDADSTKAAEKVMQPVLADLQSFVDSKWAPLAPRALSAQIKTFQEATNACGRFLKAAGKLALPQKVANLPKVTEAAMTVISFNRS